MMIAYVINSKFLSEGNTRGVHYWSNYLSNTSNYLNDFAREID